MADYIYKVELTSSERSALIEILDGMQQSIIRLVGSEDNIPDVAKTVYDLSNKIEDANREENPPEQRG